MDRERILARLREIEESAYESATEGGVPIIRVPLRWFIDRRLESEITSWHDMEGERFVSETRSNSDGVFTECEYIVWEREGGNYDLSLYYVFADDQELVIEDASVEDVIKMVSTEVARRESRIREMKELYEKDRRKDEWKESHHL